MKKILHLVVFLSIFCPFSSAKTVVDVGGKRPSISVHPIACTDGNGDKSPVLIGITTQPAALTTICAGSSVTLEVVATGTNLTYQWRKNGAPILWATFPTYTVTSTRLDVASSSTYTVVISSLSDPSVTSEKAVVIVNSLPTITLATTILSICDGSTSFPLPYTSTSNSPNRYSISGTGITPVANAALPATPITVNLSTAAVLGTPIPYTLTVTNSTTTCTSANVTGSITVNPTGVGSLEGDRQALIDFYNTTGGPTWTSTTNTSTNKWLINGACGQSPCGWNGVSCSPAPVVRVISLSANGNNLIGSIPASIRNLTALTSLQLTSNPKLTGSIPAEIGNLTNLTSLALYSNQLTGSIPIDIGNLNKLTILYLFNNQLTGSIPPEIGNLTTLTQLYLNLNQLSGSIPDTIGNLTKLVTLVLNNNQLTGNMPMSIGKLANLTSLNLNFNKLTSNIPDTIGNLTKLTSLTLGGNQLSGSVPTTIGNLINLSNLRLFANQLTGNMPSELGNLTKLTTLQLDTNRLSGSVPTSIGNLINLVNFRLNTNQLTGNIPVEIGNLVKLTTLTLTNNQLTGSLPDSLGKLTLLRTLQLDSNALTGTIPSTFRKLTLLTSLRLNDNQLTGNFNLTGVPVAAIVSIKNNKFNFDGIESNVPLLDVYTPQYKIPISNTNGVLSVIAGGNLANNTYKWYKKDANTPILMATNVGNINYTPTTSGTYFVDITNRIATALTLTSDEIVVTIPQGSLTANGPFCQSGTGQLTWTATEGTAPFTVIYNDGTADRTATDVASGTPFDVFTNPVDKTLTYRLMSVTSSGADKSVRNSGFTLDSTTITVNALPKITAQSMVSASLCAGLSTILSVSTTGTGLTYQWEKDGIEIVGANDSTYEVRSNATDIASKSLYTVIVSGTCTPSIFSDTATIIIHELPKITVQPTVSTSLCAGLGTTLSVSTTGTGLTYQWKKDGVDLTGAVDSTYKVQSNATDFANTSKYSVVVSGTCTPSVFSDSATIIIHELPKITAQPVISTTLCAGIGTTLNITATGTGLAYQWKKDGINVPNANSNAYLVASNATDTASISVYSVVVSGTCTPSVSSELSAVIINALPKITAQPMASTTICAGNSPLNLRISATGTGLTYQWRKSGVDISGATAAIYSVISATSDTASTSKYSVVVGGTCTPSLFSDTAIVIVNSLLNISSRPLATTAVCVGATATLNVAATGTGLTYQWRKNNISISGATNATYSINATVPNDAGAYSVIIGSTCSRNDTSVKTILVIDPMPSAISGDPSVYATFSTTFTNAVAGGRWRSSNPVTAKVDSITGVVTGLLFGTTTISYTVTNACGVNTVTKDFTVIRNTVKMALKVFLQGPYNANNGFMDATLRINGFLPTVEPYSGMSNFTHKGPGGGELFENTAISTVIGNNAIVDWVFIELRDKINPSKVVATRAALLQRDGDVVDTDGTSALTFNEVIAGDFYIAVRHRNHLGFRTLTSKSLTANVLNLNLSDSSTPLFGSNPLKLIGAIYVMFSGNGDSNGAINAIDKNAVWLKTNGQFNYLRGDFNLDGAVNAFDINEHWRLNNAKVQQLD